jgi:uncharacterized protein (DUF2267 family)
MSRTGVDSLDRSIEKTNTWLADVAASFGTEDRRLAYRVTRSWLHTLRDRLPVPVAAHIAAQLPELLRGVFYEGWNPSKVPIKYGRDEYVARFAKDAQIHHSEVPNAGRLVTAAMRRHISAGAIDEALGVLPGDIRGLIESPDGGQAPGRPADSELAGRKPADTNLASGKPADTSQPDGSQQRADAGRGSQAAAGRAAGQAPADGGTAAGGTR